MTSYRELYKAVSDELNAGRKAVVLTRLRGSGTAGVASKELYTAAMLVKEGAEDLGASLARVSLESGELIPGTDKGGDILFAEPYVPESRLIILGGGHIARPLAEFAAKCGFAVTVTDDRPTFANRQRFPLAQNVFCESFDRCFPLLKINRSAFVVIITRGHRHDLGCLRQVLKLETAYTGMIGSKRRVRGAMEQLKAEGWPEEKLAAVRAPIGLDIGSETPEEIAVSILSEVIQFKRKRSGGSWPELDTEVLSELTEDRADGNEVRALCTIIETKGSTPRDIGAKMIVWPDGRTVGSIGGGCSESGVISRAYDVISGGGFEIVDVDMTGDVAEDEGMVCGGTMKVSVERF